MERQPAFVDSTFGGERRTLEIEAAPEHEHGIQHEVRVSDEALFVDVVVRQELGELVLRVLGVIRLDARVPGEETDVEGLLMHSLDVAVPPLYELVPEAGRRPVLDGPRRGRRDLMSSCA